MKKIILKVKKTILISFLSLFILSPWSTIFAQQSNSNVTIEKNNNENTNGMVPPTAGPTGKVGPTENTGPQEQTGPNESVGHQSNTNAINSITGPDSINKNNVNENSNTAVTSNTNSQIDNSTTADANTGNNNLEENSSVGSFESGSISTGINIINTEGVDLNPLSSIGEKTINESAGSIVLAPAESRTSISSLNSLSGPESVNLNNLSANNLFRSINNLDSIVNNNISISADSGSNTFDSNTLVGQITTGSINVAVNLINLSGLTNPSLVLNLDFWSILSDYHHDLIIPANYSNQITGPASENLNSVTKNNSVTSNNSSNESLKNSVDVDANTGENTLTKNSYIGEIKTGQAKIDGSIVNISNTNSPIFYIVNVFGKWSGKTPDELKGNVLVNQITGPGSRNENNIISDASLELSDNHNTKIDNLVNIKANTGGNLVTNNTAIGSLSTGNIYVLANIANFLSAIRNSAGNQYRLGIINIYGNWDGTIKKEIPQYNPTSASNDNNETKYQRSEKSLEIDKISDMPINSSSSEENRTTQINKPLNIKETSNASPISDFELSPINFTSAINTKDSSSTEGSKGSPLSTTQRLRYLLLLMSGATFLGLLIRKNK